MSKKKRENSILSRIQQKLTKHTRGGGQSLPSLSSFMGGTGLGGGGKTKAPKGFRPISMTQAMIEFAAPIMAYVENGVISDPNDALQLGMHLWNFTLPRAQMKKSRKDLVKGISRTLRLKPKEAEQFFEDMLTRKAHLFPDEIQPEGTLTMFMRKETEGLRQNK